MTDSTDLAAAPLPVAPRGVPSSDETLMEQVAGGSRDAFADLYDRVAPAVYGMARRVCVDPSIAEEVTQDVLLAVWTRARSFDRSRGSARSWILTMAHRRAIDVVRSEQAARTRNERVAAASNDRPFDEVADAVVATMASRSNGREVRQALRSLSALQRSALELAYFKGMTYREVAQVLEVPLGTAKTRIRDGMQRLAEQLAPAAG